MTPLAPPLLRTRLARRRGYTAVEILMAMTVMAIGAAAVMSMQKASIAGNLDAHKTDVANSIARAWVERLHRESMQWTLPSPSNPTGNNFPGVPLLANHVNGQWFLPIDDMNGPNTPPETMSPGFDLLGRDLPSANLGSALFCVNVRLRWLVPQALGAVPPEPGLIRADVRVLWPRGYVNAPPATGFCNAAVAQLVNPDPTNPPVYHAIYLSTTLKETPAQ